MIEVQAPNGSIVEFPDGTDNRTIEQAMRKSFPVRKKPQGGYANKLAQGATSGWSDEIYGGISGAINTGKDLASGKIGSWGDFTKSLSTNYKRSRNYERDRLVSAAKKTGAAGTATEIGGGILSAVAMAALAKKFKINPRLPRGAGKKAAVAGAVSGGVYGAGASDKTSVGGVAGDAAAGAGAGAVGGVALQKVVGPLVGGLARGGKSAVKHLKTRNTPEYFIRKAIKEGNDTPQRLLAELRKRQASARDAGLKPAPEMLMDTSSGLTNLARNVRTLGGDGKNLLDKIIGQQSDSRAVLSRLRANLKRGTGTSGTGSAYHETKAVTEAARQKATPLYEAAYEKSQPVDLSPMVSQAKKAAEQYGPHSPIRKPIEKVASELEYAGQRGGGVGSVDMAKRTIDSLQEKLQRKGVDDRDINDLRKSMLTQTDKANPIFAQARAASAEGKQFEAAVDEGRKAMSMAPDAIPDVLKAQISEHGRKGFRIGGIDGILTKAGNKTGGDYAIGMRSPNMQVRLAALAQKGKGKALQDVMKRESDIFRTRSSVVGGSQTADKGAAAAAHAADMGAVTAAARDGARGVTTMALNKAVAGIARRFDRSGKYNKQIAQMLVEQDPRKIEGILRRIGQQMPDAKRQALRRMVQAQRKSAMVGAGAGQVGARIKE